MVKLRTSQLSFDVRRGFICNDKKHDSNNLHRSKQHFADL